MPHFEPVQRDLEQALPIVNILTRIQCVCVYSLEYVAGQPQPVDFTRLH